MVFRFFDHTADLGVEVEGADRAELYAASACALFDLLTDRTALRAETSRTVAASGQDEADLLVNFLRELLYAWNGEGFLGRDCVVKSVSTCRIEALLRGEPFDPTRHRILMEIKAVTYHLCEVRQRPEGAWLARVVFDV
jgi:SHS2 domain-containing protein